jgi:D-alanyl-D-alanine carboxypeptidase
MEIAATVRKSFRFALYGGLVLFAVVLAISLPSTRALAGGYADIVIDASTGEVLHSRNPDILSYPASLTKMMTLYLLFDALEKGEVKLDTALPVSAHAADQPATKLGLPKGASIPVETAILAIIIQSANDAAVVVAEALGGTESDFAAKMTRAARALGMRSTVFRNASGLPDPGQKSTARDLAVLARALITDFPQYYHYFSVQKFTYGGRVIRTHNRLMLAYDGADGLKTGYIRASGYNLVTSAVRDGQRLIGVVLGGKSPSARDQQMAKLLDGGFAELAMADIDTNRNPVLPDLKPADLGAAIQTADAQSDSGNASAEAVAAFSGEGDANSGDDDPEASSNGTDLWGVQVGAFTRFAPAHLAATNAQREYRGLVDARVVVDETTTSTGKAMYRSRLVGLSRTEADAACRGLKKLGTPCLVIRAGTAVAQNSAQ